MRLEASSVVLRCPEPSDEEQIYAYWGDWDVLGHLGGFRAKTSRADVRQWIEFHRQCQNEMVWVIAEKQSDACLGHVGLYVIDHRLQKAEFAICIGAKEQWRKGIGREICSRVIDFGFHQLNLRQIRLTVLETNAKARSLYESLGFEYDGRLRDEQFRDGRFVNLMIMSLFRDQWSPQEP